MHTFKEAVTTSEVKAEVDSVLEALTNEICSHLDGLSKEIGCKSVLQANSVASETIQLKCGEQRKFENLKNAATAGVGCECGKQTSVQEKCIFCRLERHYLDHDTSPQVCTEDLYQPSTQTRLYHKERLLVPCGVLDGKVLNAKTFPERTVGWPMEVNLDHLAMAFSGIPDI